MQRLHGCKPWNCKTLGIIHERQIARSSPPCLAGPALTSTMYGTVVMVVSRLPFHE
jgi:hypothetical protein